MGSEKDGEWIAVVSDHSDAAGHPCFRVGDDWVVHWIEPFLGPASGEWVGPGDDLIAERLRKVMESSGYKNPRSEFRFPVARHSSQLVWNQHLVACRYQNVMWAFDAKPPVVRDD